MDLSYAMNLWIHTMHKHINVHTSIMIILMSQTYWYNIRTCTKENHTSPNIFIHDFIIKILSQNISFTQRAMFWKKHIENEFYSHSQISELWNIYMKTQRTCNGFKILSRLWKIKRLSVKVNTDLYMNKITLKKGKSISIYQNGSLYYFTISDLINICNSSLMNSPNFFCEPRIPKNPYTNIPFSNANLYSIYDALRHSNYRMSNLLHLYYLCNFDIDLFYYKHEAFIRDEYINSFIKTSNSDDLFPYVREMLSKIVIPNKIDIDKDFPQDVLVRIMRPFLKLYLFHTSSISNTEYRFRAYFELKYKLTKFQEYNPTFGRLIMIKKPPTIFNKPKISYIRSYNTYHIAFNDIHIDENVNLYENKDEPVMFDASNNDLSDNETSTNSTTLSTILNPDFIMYEQNIAANLFVDSTPNLSDDDMEMDDTDSVS